MDKFRAPRRTQRAKAAMAINGNPPIRFEVDDRAFLATLPRRPQ